MIGRSETAFVTMLAQCMATAVSMPTPMSKLINKSIIRALNAPISSNMATFTSKISANQTIRTPLSRLSVKHQAYPIMILLEQPQSPAWNLVLPTKIIIARSAMKIVKISDSGDRVWSVQRWLHILIDSKTSLVILYGTTWFWVRTDKGKFCRDARVMIYNDQDTKKSFTNLVLPFRVLFTPLNTVW